MRIVMIGAGYVGLVTGACFAEFGFEVACVDKDLEKVSKLKLGKVPIFEPNLCDLVVRNLVSGRLSFTQELGDAMRGASAVFIAVGTPNRCADGQPDLCYVYEAANSIAEHLGDYTVVVTKSTVPVGTTRQVAQIIRGIRPEADFDVVSNPEFLREGSAISDFMRPDRIVIGTESGRALAIMRQLYKHLDCIETPIVATGLETAELTKYAGNAFLATKITFINEIANLCEKVGADVQQVARGIGLDGRIGQKFLHPGPGYGGSCFPKDTLALVRTAQKFGAPTRIVETVIEVNNLRRQSMAERIVEACGGTLIERAVAVLGVTFKPNTDDIRDSPSLAIISMLIAYGAKVRAFDPAGMAHAKRALPDVEWFEDAYGPLAGADCLVIMTEWDQFRSLDLSKLKSLLLHPVIVDLRNVYDPACMIAAGFTYHSIGRPLNFGGPAGFSPASPALSEALSRS